MSTEPPVRRRRRRSKKPRSWFGSAEWRAQNNMKICSYCGNRNSKGGRKCPQCKRPYGISRSPIPFIFVGLIIALILALFFVK
jgi:ribosomal protein L40E